MVSCKRKSHHPLSRRKQPGKTLLPSNNDGQQELLASDPSEFPVNTINRRGTGDTGLDQDECSIFSEVRRTGTAVITTLHVPFLDIIIRCNLISALARSRNNDRGVVWQEAEAESVFNPLAPKCWRAFSILSKVKLKYIFLPSKRHYLFRCLTVMHFFDSLRTSCLCSLTLID